MPNGEKLRFRSAVRKSTLQEKQQTLLCDANDVTVQTTEPEHPSSIGLIMAKIGNFLSEETMEDKLPSLTKQENAQITQKNTSYSVTNHIFLTVNTDAHPTLYYY